MYELIPSQEEINNFKVKLTSGEQKLVNQLSHLFSQPKYQHREFKIFVQANLFFGKPDIIVLEPNHTIWIIEVKDYHLNSYHVTLNIKKKDKKEIKEDKWSLTHIPMQTIPSPFTQSNKYKKELLSVISPELEELAKHFYRVEKMKNKYSLMVRNAVYFSNFNSNDINHLKASLEIEPTSNKFNYCHILFDDISSHLFNEFFEQTRVNKYKLNNSHTTEILAILDPGESGKNDPLPEFKSNKYIRLSKSNKIQQKIRGSAGTGKSTVLAKRVVDARNRLGTDKRILVTYYNISIGNFLRDKITAEAGMNLSKLGVDLINFHSLYKWKEINDSSSDDENDTVFIIDGPANEKKYHAIFIDEGQDFDSDWFDLIKKDYLYDKHEEFVIFADEDQNIYSNMKMSADESEGPNDTTISLQLPSTPITGRWNTLTTNFRASNQVIDTVSKDFLEHFIINNSADNYSSNMQQIDLITGYNQIYYRQMKSELDVSNTIHNFVDYLVTQKNAAINDIAILCDLRKQARTIEENLKKLQDRQSYFKHLSCTFITNEEHIKYNYDFENDTSKKLKFQRNSGPIKFSTIKSFKGWESKFVILVLSPFNENSDNSEKNENIKLDMKSYHTSNYIGLTRAKEELLILDLSDLYSEYFFNLPSDLVHKKVK